MQTDHARTLELRVRRNHGRRMGDAWRAQVASALGRPASTIETTSLEAVDAAVEATELRLSEPPLKTDTAFAASDLEELARRLDALVGAVRGRTVYLLRPDSEYCGAVITTLGEVLDRVAELVPVEGDDVVAVSPDNSIGLVIDYVAESPDYRPEFIVRFWSDADGRNSGT